MLIAAMNGEPSTFCLSGAPCPPMPGSARVHFYRAMHFSAKRDIEIACPSVCNVGIRIT